MTSPRPDFARALQDLDAAIEQCPTPRVRNQPKPLKKRFRGPAPAGLVLTAAALLLIVWRAWPPAADPSETQVTFAPATCAPAEVAAKLSLALGCTLEVTGPDLAMEALDDAVLSNTPAGIRVEAGEVRFDVAPVRTGDKVVVMVSGGRIEVIGTRFTVREHGDSGQVDLQEGRIDFVTHRGARIALSPGASYSWHVAGDVVRPATWSKVRIEEEVAAVTRARADRRFDAARQRLGLLLRAPVGEPVAEILSYELGTILQDELQDRNAACTHWREHEARFSGGQYAAQVRTWISTCERGNSEGDRE